MCAVFPVRDGPLTTNLSPDERGRTGTPAGQPAPRVMSRGPPTVGDRRASRRCTVTSSKVSTASSSRSAIDAATTATRAAVNAVASWWRSPGWSGASTSQMVCHGELESSKRTVASGNGSACNDRSNAADRPTAPTSRPSGGWRPGPRTPRPRRRPARWRPRPGGRRTAAPARTPETIARRPWRSRAPTRTDQVSGALPARERREHGHPRHRPRQRRDQRGGGGQARSGVSGGRRTGGGVDPGRHVAPARTRRHVACAAAFRDQAAGVGAGDARCRPAPPGSARAAAGGARAPTAPGRPGATRSVTYRARARSGVSEVGGQGEHGGLGQP